MDARDSHQNSSAKIAPIQQKSSVPHAISAYRCGAEAPDLHKRAATGARNSCWMFCRNATTFELQERSDLRKHKPEGSPFEKVTR